MRKQHKFCVPEPSGPNRQMLRRTLLLMAVCGAAAFALLLARLYRLQILDHGFYEQRAIEYLLESPCFGLTWDVGHSKAVRERDVPFIMAHRDKLIHFHIHDGTETPPRNHLALGDGEIDLADRLRLAQSRNARCVLHGQGLRDIQVLLLRRECHAGNRRPRPQVGQLEDHQGSHLHQEGRADPQVQRVRQEGDPRSSEKVSA